MVGDIQGSLPEFTGRTGQYCQSVYRPAEAQYRQAQSMVQSASGRLFPTSTVRQPSIASVPRAVKRGGFRCQVSVWSGVKRGVEPDLWGSVRRQVESSEASAQASAATLQALRLSTQTTLAQNYFLLRALDAQIKLLNDTIVTYEKTLKITQNRYAAGIAAKSEIVQAEAQLQSAQAQAINIGVQRAQFEHAIAMLIGKIQPNLPSRLLR